MDVPRFLVKVLRFFTPEQVPLDLEPQKPETKSWRLSRTDDCLVAVSSIIPRYTEGASISPSANGINKRYEYKRRLAPNWFNVRLLRPTYYMKEKEQIMFWIMFRQFSSFQVASKALTCKQIGKPCHQERA
ncbi:hypothetical protein OUZ56_014374 [Daphnia magna]|uniref:Uncharacterized protein n=1 Tax=Daphnia magna TaxID=35525 RepID=A0ABR0AJR3_9CRUS|nr:hypothetical protein OUZ56_014374 [Daphnia magna]